MFFKGSREDYINRLYEYLIKNNFLFDKQFGFRKGHGLITVAHKCHGKRKTAAAKKEIVHSKRKKLPAKENNSREKEKDSGKRKLVVAKEKLSRQKKITHGKKKDSR